MPEISVVVKYDPEQSGQDWKVRCRRDGEKRSKRKEERQHQRTPKWLEWADGGLVLVDDVDCGWNADGEIQDGVYIMGETQGAGIRREGRE